MLKYFALATLFLFSANSFANDISTRVIYGEDDRKDLYEIKDSNLIESARSTAVLVYEDQLIDKGNYYDTVTETFKDALGLCPTEPFAHQYSTGFCSGFLVDNKTLVTAGHCVRSESKCKSTAFAFDFATKDKNDPGPTQFPKENVFHCKKLLSSYVNGNGADYAIIELDREVQGRTPLNVRKSGSVKDGDALIVIGYPSGVPVKVAAGANVRSQSSGYFVANLDTYGGNSGSAVFNEGTGEVEGILVRGETDFVYQNSCRVSNVCDDDGCRGEDVTRITDVFKSLEEIRRTENREAQMRSKKLEELSQRFRNLKD